MFALVGLLLLVPFAEAGVGLSSEMIGVTTSLTPEKELSTALVQTQNSRGLVDPNRFSFQNTIGMSFRSGGREGLSQYYLNTITYKAAKPLTIQAQVGLENNLYGSPIIGPSGRGGNVRIVVPYLRALYQPRPNIQIEIQFSNRPHYYGYGGATRIESDPGLR